MSLKQQLDSFRDRFMAEAEAEIVQAMLRADAELIASGVAQRALKAGDLAPDFTLPDARGGTVSLSRLLRDGPVVLSFFRGVWCPYCRLELAALAETLPAMATLNATLVAISPQKSPAGDFPFAVLCDGEAKVATSFGLAFELPHGLRDVYARFGHALPAVNDGGGWVLPLPATYVIGRDSRIALSFVDADYRNRLEPQAVSAALAGLAGREGA